MVSSCKAGMILAVDSLASCTYIFLQVRLILSGSFHRMIRIELIMLRIPLPYNCQNRCWLSFCIKKSPFIEIEWGLFIAMKNLLSPANHRLLFVIFIAQRGKQADRHEGAYENECDDCNYGHINLLLVSFLLKPNTTEEVPCKILTDRWLQAQLRRAYLRSC